VAKPVKLGQYFHHHPLVAPQPQVSKYHPSHFKQSLMCYFEYTVFFMFSFAFSADFQLEEQPPQLSKVLSYVPRS
jgi:hypothetical protein